MEDYIQISKLNDFIFCPLSLYFHSLYEDFNVSLYHDIPQRVGCIKHESIESKSYSSSKHILQGIDIYSAEFGIAGKIDIYNTNTRHLVERKTKINKIYDGYLMQLYSQYYCLCEMGLSPIKLSFHSISDNKRYVVRAPNKEDRIRLKSLIGSIRTFSLAQNYYSFKKNLNKCKHCIYSELCR